MRRQELHSRQLEQTKGNCRARAEQLDALAPPAPPAAPQGSVAPVGEASVPVKRLYAMRRPVLPPTDATPATVHNTKWFGELATACETPQQVVARSPVETRLVSADDRCNVCLGDFDSEEPAVRLPKCPPRSHWFHSECIQAALTVSQRCPCCFQLYGCMTGTMPPGTMSVGRHPGTLPGQPPGSGTFYLSYNFLSGIQVIGRKQKRRRRRRRRNKKKMNKK